MTGGGVRFSSAGPRCSPRRPAHPANHAAAPSSISSAASVAWKRFPGRWTSSSVLRATGGDTPRDDARRSTGWPRSGSTDPHRPGTSAASARPSGPSCSRRTSSNPRRRAGVASGAPAIRASSSGFSELLQSVAGGLLQEWIIRLQPLEQEFPGRRIGLAAHLLGADERRVVRRRDPLGQRRRHTWIAARSGVGIPPQPPDPPLAVQGVRLVNPVAEVHGAVGRDGDPDRPEVVPADDHRPHRGAEGGHMRLGEIGFDPVVAPGRDQQRPAIIRWGGCSPRNRGCRSAPRPYPPPCRASPATRRSRP